MFALVFGGILTDALFLAGRPQREVERATAIGFFLGFGFAAVALLIDALT